MANLTPYKMEFLLVYRTLCWDQGERQERTIYGKVSIKYLFEHI